MFQAQHRVKAEDLFSQAVDLMQSGMNDKRADWLLRLAQFHATLAAVPDQPDYRGMGPL